jgi:parallel beta-helix repeat protein
MKTTLEADDRRMPFGTKVGFVMLPVLIAVVALGAGAEPAQPQSASCDRVAAPGGSDGNAGTAGDPFRTVGRLASVLSPGQTGCLRGGVFRENVTVRHGGRTGAPITLTAYPGTRPKLEGRLVIERDAQFVTVADLALDGTASPACARGTSCAVYPSPTVYGDHAILRGNDITNRRGICVILGRSGDPMTGALIQGNRIHHCGRRPRTNHDHGVYAENASNGRIVGNVIYDNADRGVQLYPSAQSMRIAGNVIDGNGQGVIFSGERRSTSNGNVVEGNVIANASASHNVESYYPSGTPVGRGNIVRGNCLFGGVRNREDGGVQSPQVGFVATGNRASDPSYVNRGAGDFRLRGDSPCQGVLRP